MTQLNVNKKELVRLLSILVEPTEVSNPVSIIGAGDTVFLLNQESYEAYDKAYNILLDFDDLSRKYSRKTIRSSFNRFLANLIRDEEDVTLSPDQIKKELHDWLTELVEANKHEFTYFVVIDNLKIYKQLSIGKVQLEPLTEETANELVNKISNKIDKLPSYEEQEREQVKKTIEKSILDQFGPDRSSSALGSLTLVAYEIEKGQDAAIKHFQEVLHLLRFLGVFVYGNSQGEYIKLGLRGELLHGVVSYLAVSDKGGWRVNQSRIGRVSDFNLTADIINRFQELGLDALSEILSKSLEDQTELERRLISSITWISKATLDLSEYESFILLCISLENLLGSNDIREGITRLLSERLALLLENDRDKRIELFKNTMAILRIRGEIVHTGQPKKELELIKYSGLLLYYTCSAIIIISRLMDMNEWGKFSEVERHFEHLKFSSSS